MSIKLLSLSRARALSLEDAKQKEVKTEWEAGWEFRRMQEVDKEEEEPQITASEGPYVVMDSIPINAPTRERERERAELGIFLRKIRKLVGTPAPIDFTP